MNCRILRDFFEGQVSATALDADLRGAFEQRSTDTYRLRMEDLSEDFTVESPHLVKLCDAVLDGKLDPDALRAVGFGLISSDHFHWDADEPDGALIAETLHDWASPEANYPLSTGNVSKFKHRLLTRDDVFTRADAQPIIRGVITGAPMRRPPNTRLKLSAPVLHGFGEHPDMRCGSIPFVNLHAWRRSLSAVR